MFGVTFTPDTSNDNNYEILGSLNLRTNSCPDSLVDLALVIVVLDAPDVNGALMPLKTNLAPAYPNPFNPTVTLPVEIAQGGIFSLRIYDILGREAASIFNGRLEPGRFEFVWQASELATGRYIAVLQASDGARYETPLTLLK